MHGDLAARNILIQKVKDENGQSSLVAKVSDFGLSKTFYDNIRYKRQNQNDVPWKWMALEYLQSGHLTITSDVWSYGVVLWEILSIGREPYTNFTVDEMLSQFKNGYYLPCPEEALEIKTWNSKHVYENLAQVCFIADPMKRATFSDIVEELERNLDNDELLDYTRLSAQYLSNRNVDQGSQKSDRSYLDMSQNIALKNTHLESQNALNQKMTNELLPHPSNGETHNLITPKMIEDSNDCSSSDSRKDKCDIFNENTLGCEKYNGAIVNQSQSKNVESQIPDTSYITIETANNS
jgi:serine/threonine protein kinase